MLRFAQINPMPKYVADEFAFWIHPAVWGPGARPFESDEQIRVRLVDSKVFDSGVTLLRYVPA